MPERLLHCIEPLGGLATHPMLAELECDASDLIVRTARPQLPKRSLQPQRCRMGLDQIGSAGLKPSGGGMLASHAQGGEGGFFDESICASTATWCLENATGIWSAPASTVSRGTLS